MRMRIEFYIHTVLVQKRNRTFQTPNGTVYIVRKFGDTFLQSSHFLLKGSLVCVRVCHLFHEVFEVHVFDARVGLCSCRAGPPSNCTCFTKNFLELCDCFGGGPSLMSLECALVTSWCRMCDTHGHESLNTFKHREAGLCSTLARGLFCHAITRFSVTCIRVVSWESFVLRWHNRGSRPRSRRRKSGTRRTVGTMRVFVSIWVISEIFDIIAFCPADPTEAFCLHSQVGSKLALHRIVSEYCKDKEYEQDTCPELWIVGPDSMNFTTPMSY